MSYNAYAHATNIRIVNLLLMETGTYNEQYLRPLVTDIDQRAIDTITERVINNPNHNITPGTMTDLASSFLSPMVTPESTVKIPNSWNNRRLRFSMKIMFDLMGGQSTEFQYIYGYTDFAGANVNTLSIAPEMVFFVNSVLRTKMVRHHTPMGVQEIEQIMGADQVLSVANMANTGFYEPNSYEMLRPFDTFTIMDRSILNAADMSTADTRNRMTTEAKMSRRSNNMPAAYVGKVMNSYLGVMQESSLMLGQSDQHYIGAAKDLAREFDVGDDPFISAMAQIRSMGYTNTFRYVDLQRLDSNVGNVLDYIVRGNAQAQYDPRPTHETGMTAGWGGTDPVTMAAVKLGQFVPSLMMELFITKLVFKATNATPGMQVMSTIVDAGSMSNANMRRNYDTFLRRLEREGLVDVSGNGLFTYDIEVHADLLGDTWIRISLDGCPYVDYASPSFCDSLTTSMITSSPNVAGQLATDLNNLVNQVSDNLSASDASAFYVDRL